jgi:hypothetical protein
MSSQADAECSDGLISSCLGFSLILQLHLKPFNMISSFRQ